jgi:hypothetical protein
MAETGFGTLVFVFINVVFGDAVFAIVDVFIDVLDVVLAAAIELSVMLGALDAGS